MYKILYAFAPNCADFSNLTCQSRSAKTGQGAERGKFYRPIKQQLTVRVDADVLEWLKSQGSGYQSRLNDILRSAMLGAPL
jgi:uncharacterized protein (DUF4415 family)